MTLELDEAIKHAEEVAKQQEEMAWEAELQEEYEKNKSCKECAEDHRQLAEWLKELKKLREQTKWIPVSERLIETLQNNEEYDCSYIGEKPYDDCISRQAVLDAMRDNYRDGGRDIDGDYVEGNYSEKLYDAIMSLSKLYQPEVKKC